MHTLWIMWKRAGAVALAIALAALVGMPTMGFAAQSLPPRVEMTLVRVERPGSRLNVQTPEVKQVPLGASARLVIYGYLTGLKPGTTARVALSVSGGGRAYFVSRGTESVAKMTGTLPGWRWFWTTIHPCATPPAAGTVPECLPQAPGRYRLNALIVLAGREVVRSSSFLVVRG